MTNPLKLLLAVAAIVLCGGYLITSNPGTDEGKRAASSPGETESQEVWRDKCIENCS